MSNIRASGYFLQEPDDDESFQMLVGDVERLAIQLDNTIPSGSIIPVQSGGTGANNAAQARINLGITAENLGVSSAYGFANESMAVSINSAIVTVLVYASATTSGLTYSAANGRFSAATDGDYVVNAECTIGSGGSNMSANGPSIYIYKNASTLIHTARTSAYTFGGALDLYWTIPISCGVSLAAGDYITIRWQGSGSYSSSAQIVFSGINIVKVS